MSQPEVSTDFSEATLLAVFAGKYYEADLALWRFKTDLRDTEPNAQQAAHLAFLRNERRATYMDLVGQAATAEAERLTR